MAPDGRVSVVAFTAGEIAEGLDLQVPEDLQPPPPLHTLVSPEGEATSRVVAGLAAVIVTLGMVFVVGLYISRRK